MENVEIGDHVMNSMGLHGKVVELSQWGKYLGATFVTNYGAVCWCPLSKLVLPTMDLAGNGSLKQKEFVFMPKSNDEEWE